MNGGFIIDNKAGNFGGGIYNAGGGIVNLSNVTIGTLGRPYIHVDDYRRWKGRRVKGQIDVTEGMVSLPEIFTLRPNGVSWYVHKDAPQLMNVTLAVANVL